VAVTSGTPNEACESCHGTGINNFGGLADNKVLFEEPCEQCSGTGKSSMSKAEYRRQEERRWDKVRREISRERTWNYLRSRDFRCDVFSTLAFFATLAFGITFLRDRMNEDDLIYTDLQLDHCTCG
jgi:hypothetical protein